MRSLTIILMCLMLTGCSSKVVTWDSMGEKTVTTRTNEDIYHEQQSKAWAGYYAALQNPPVIATVTTPDGAVININSQVPPPAPIIQQHKNQYIKPIADIIKWGIGGIVVDRGLRAIVKGAGDTIVDNAGDGTVYVDRSDSIASKTDASFNTETDSSVVNPDPVIVNPEVVRPEIVDPVIVEQGE